MLTLTRSSPARVAHHGQSAPFGSARGQLLWARLAALGGVGSPRKRPAPPLPRVVELASSNVADPTAFDL
eukprot:scaffold64846_cov21-Phaeocystis_antarctica.AAC.1